MPKVEEIKAKIGTDSYAHIEKLADSEVGEAMAMQLIDQYRKERYYRRKPLMEVQDMADELGVDLEDALELWQNL